jgi:hypothetical protein
MEQVTADKSVGKALWKSAKYMQRVTYAITEITEIAWLVRLEITGAERQNERFVRETAPHQERGR